MDGTDKTAAFDGSGGDRQHILPPRIEKILKSIEILTAVKVALLDPSGNMRADRGATPDAGPAGDAILDQSLLQMAMRTTRPILHRGATEGVAVSVPFLQEGRLAGFVSASGFNLAQTDATTWEQLRRRFIVDGGLEEAQSSAEGPLFEGEKLLALSDLLEAATAQITLLATGARRLDGDAVTDESEPLAWTVSNILEQISAAAQNGAGISKVVEDRERMEALYNSTQYAILMLDRELQIVAANNEFGKTFGTDPAAFIGVSGAWLRNWVVKNSQDPTRVSAMVERLFANPDEVLEEEIELLSPKHMILRFFSSPVKSKIGEIIGRVLMFRDITQFRQERHEMIGSEKMGAINTVAAGLAHELNNILAGVVTYADYVLEEGNPDKIREALKMSIAAAEESSDLIGKLLVVAGSCESQRQDVDLHLEIGRLLDTLEPEFKKDSVRVHRLLEPVPRVNVDPVQMQEAFRNILSNARQAIGCEGTITVKTEADWDSGNVRITISDSGPGIPAELLDRVFDPFFTTRGVVSGGADSAARGLGLSVTKGIIENHCGKIYAGNVMPHGASFVIELPLSGAPAQETPAHLMY